MEERKEDRRIILKHESCFDFLKTIASNSVDLVLIDPPYEVSRDTNFQAGKETGKDTDRFRVSMDFADCSAHLKVAGSDVRTPQYMTSRGLSIHN